ncbi:hypothetical protein M2401_000071 [Pseudomonas sp. JUb42]|jgi:hypothetical protein|nr:hypothetical protein [Pseudomonas sp. JUb42]
MRLDIHKVGRGRRFRRAAGLIVFLLGVLLLIGRALGWLLF